MKLLPVFLLSISIPYSIQAAPVETQAAIHQDPAPYTGVADVSIILTQNQFFPNKVRLKDGVQTRLTFTTVNKKPAALIIEPLRVQRWIASAQEAVKMSADPEAKFKYTRELNSAGVTQVLLDPTTGVYSFYDVVGGARGEIIVDP